MAAADLIAAASEGSGSVVVAAPSLIEQSWIEVKVHEAAAWASVDLSSDSMAALHSAVQTSSSCVGGIPSFAVVVAAASDRRKKGY